MISTELIRRYPFFSRLSSDQIVALARAGEELVVEPGYYFFREGDELQHFYLVLAGNVSVTIGVPDRSDGQYLAEQLTGSFSKQEITVSTLNSGEIFGWSGLIPPHLSSANARAGSSCQIVAFNCPELLQQFDEDSRFGYLMMQKAAQVIRQRLQNNQIESLAFSAS